jgi:hypothetical protein
MSKVTGLPLHKRTHFRRIREIFTEIGEYERINLDDYDLFNMRVYESVGDDLKGKNVSYDTEGNQSIWVFGNNYELFEVPAKRNKKGWLYGDFLFLARNVSYDYYLFGKMKISLDKDKSVVAKNIVEDVYYEPYGKYTIVFGTGGNNHIKKEEYGYSFTPGVTSSDHDFTFDSFNSRKLSYSYSKYKILTEIGVKDIEENKITSQKPVEIYKKSKKPNNNQKKKK